MNTPYCIVTNSKRCINCKSCQIQCKVWHGQMENLSLGMLLHQGPHMQTGKPSLRTEFLSCQHCDDPWCVRACPTGAMYKNAQGIVRVDAQICVGCKGCLVACPWQIPRWDAQTSKMTKCDFCADRLQEGLQPACVTACTTQALRFTDDPALCAPLKALQKKALCLSVCKN